MDKVQKFLKEDGSEVALILRDALFDQFWKMRDVMEEESPDE